MKHAILILAHKDFDQVRHLIEYFVRDCYVYVHIDKKAAITPEELHSIESMPQVRAVYRKFDVHWGGFSILQAELWLVEHSYQDSYADYYHLISGQDYPIKPIEAFLHFFEENMGMDYIEYKAYKTNNWEQDSFFDRFRYFFRYDDVEGRSPTGRYYIDELIRLQVSRGQTREPIHTFDTIYKGSQWMSITNISVHCILEYSSSCPSFLNRLKYTFAPEESYFHTVLLNMTGGKNVYNNCLRYIRWRGENGNNPSNLGIEHFKELQLSDAIFARKMEFPYCNELIKKIDETLITH